MTTLLPTLRRNDWIHHPTRGFFDRFFGDYGWPTVFVEEDTWSPPLDVAETDNEIVVRVEIPGMNEKDVDINLSRGLLTISGEKRAEKVENETCHCMESCYGKFSRTVKLPFEVDADKVDATFKDGVLRITLPRSEAAKPKKIEIKS